MPSAGLEALTSLACDECSTTCKKRTIKLMMAKLFSIHLDPKDIAPACKRIHNALRAGE
jgi:hypothetical protein